MEYWTRVAIQATTPVQTGTGNQRDVWASFDPDVEARVLASSAEQSTDWATPEEQPYEVQLRGAHPELLLTMRVLVEGEPFDIRRIVPSPPFGSPTTTLFCVKVTP